MIGGKMSDQPNISERVAALEKQVAWLTQLHRDDSGAGGDDWRSTIGMFAGDPIMKEIIEEGRKFRERDRELTRE
jgi:hypothetical protein